MNRNVIAKNITLLDLPKSVTSDTLFRECYQAVRAYNKTLLEGQQLTPDQINSIFQNAEAMKSDAGSNRTLVGQGAQALGAVGAKIKQLAGMLQDTTPVRGLDAIYDSLKQKVSQSMGTAQNSAGVLRSIDHYQQLSRKYPTTQKFFWGAAMVLTGALTGGATLPIILGSIKAIDSMVQGDRFSTAIGKGTATGAGAYGIHKAIGAAQAGIHGAQDLAHRAGDAYNNWHPGSAHAGELPPSTVTPPVAPGAEAYTTVGGDQLGKIAQAHHTTTQAIIDANPNVASALKAAMNGKDMPIGLKMNIPTGGAGGSPWAGNKFFPLKEAIAKIYTPVLIPMSEMVDKESTVRKWALNESLGRVRGKSVELTEAGIATLFYNVDRLDSILHEAFDPEIDEARRNNYGRETSTALGQTAGRKGQTAQQFATANPQAAAAIRTANPTSNDYRMDQPDDTLAAKAPGANVSSAPAASTPPETEYKGPVGNGIMDKIEGGLKSAGNWASGIWKQATTRVTKERLMSIWKEAGKPTDSDAVADVLVKAKLDPQFIQSIYEKMGLPKPPALAPANKSQSTGFYGADIYQDAETNNAFSKVSTEELAQLIANPTPEISQASLQAMKAEYAKRSQGAGSGAQGSGAQGSGAQQSQPNTPQQQQAVARTVRQQIDDIMHTILTQHNDDQPALVKYLRQRLDQNFPAAAAAADTTPAAAPADSEVDPHNIPYDAEPTPPVARTTSSDIAPASTTPLRKVAERKHNRVYGGRYVKESADSRLARQFEQFVNTLG